MVDSDCAAVEPVFYQRVIALERTETPLGVVHVDKSIIGFGPVCETNKSKATTSLSIPILHDNLPAP
jgi:hypothetical protein